MKFHEFGLTFSSVFSSIDVNLDVHVHSCILRVFDTSFHASCLFFTSNVVQTRWSWDFWNVLVRTWNAKKNVLESILLHDMKQQKSKACCVSPGQSTKGYLGLTMPPGLEPPIFHVLWCRSSHSAMNAKLQQTGFRYHHEKFLAIHTLWYVLPRVYQGRVLRAALELEGNRKPVLDQGAGHLPVRSETCGRGALRRGHPTPENDVEVGQNKVGGDQESPAHQQPQSH